jgi:hypothetical protein
MKRFTLALAALVALAGFTGTAYAQATASHWAFRSVPFRVHIATEVGVAGDPGGVDSVYASGIAKFDTTAAVSTSGWADPQATGNAVDSVTIARLIIHDAGLANVSAGKTSATAESIYIKTQVSPNGSIWFDAAVIAGQSPVLNAFTVQTTVNAGVVTFTASQNTGISDKMWSLRFVSGSQSASRKDAVDIYNINQFPFVRWIIMGSRSLNHSYKVLLGYRTTNASVQPGT